MPHVVIDGQRHAVSRIMLPVAEVAPLIDRTESEVVRMIQRGLLTDVSRDLRRRQLDPDEVIDLIERDVAAGRLGEHVYAELLVLLRT